MEVAFDPAVWSDYFVATAGIGAALAGLVFVALSINLRDILRFPGVVGRGAESLIVLLSVALVGMVGLWPVEAWLVGRLLLLLGVVVWVTVVFVTTRPGAHAGATRNQTASRVLLGQWATLPTIAAGLSLILTTGPGLHLLIIGAFGCLAAGVIGAWVLLVEILR